MKTGCYERSLGFYKEQWSGFKFKHLNLHIQREKPQVWTVCNVKPPHWGDVSVLESPPTYNGLCRNKKLIFIVLNHTHTHAHKITPCHTAQITFLLLLSQFVKMTIMMYQVSLQLGSNFILVVMTFAKCLMIHAWKSMLFLCFLWKTETGICFALFCLSWVGLPLTKHSWHYKVEL